MRGDVMRATTTTLWASLLLAATVLLGDPATVRAEEGPPSAVDRAKILQAELSRRSADLAPWLEPDADPRLQQMRGSFSLVIADRAHDVLLAAIDRMGRQLLLWPVSPADTLPLCRSPVHLLNQKVSHCDGPVLE